MFLASGAEHLLLALHSPLTGSSGSIVAMETMHSFRLVEALNWYKRRSLSEWFMHQLSVLSLSS